MVRKLSLVLLALVLIMPLACAKQVKAPEQPLQVYPTDMENQGFTNGLMEVEAKLKECERGLTNCPDVYNEAQRLKAAAYDAWVRCDSAEAWDLLKQALAKAQEACCDVVVVIEEAAPIVLSWDHALFDFDKSNIRPDAAEVLDRVAEDMILNPETKVVILGNTDSIGTDEYNNSLSKSRADSAVRYLIEKGVNDSQIHSIKAQGKLFPVVPNRVDGRDNPFNRQKNRRVEIIVYE
jgi:outer membrane protein OmpA-like peptidoglycan-associated protein